MSYADGGTTQTSRIPSIYTHIASLYPRRHHPVVNPAVTAAAKTRKKQANKPSTPSFCPVANRRRVETPARARSPAPRSAPLPPSCRQRPGRSFHAGNATQRDECPVREGSSQGAFIRSSRFLRLVHNIIIYCGAGAPRCAIATAKHLYKYYGRDARGGVPTHACHKIPAPRPRSAT